MGSMAQPTNPDIELMQLGQVAPKEYVSILQQQDGEQNPTTTLLEEDALQIRGDEQDGEQFGSLSAPVHYRIKSLDTNLVQQLGTSTSVISLQGFNSLQITLP
ncbi:MAG: hypothetical protein EZS28_033038 [Streblomastix strix]|uniref:Uncharacterized protein n=1 Tax=Streblomastix strix TaxID=222440 RepID=A0A5J4UNW8_9EUKA|nr:MAG: hypothetical protein EZS28_033038 [Streblomastix strix]